MGDLSENFSRYEFTCKCGCGKDTVDYFLVEVLEKLRAWAKAPVRINSGSRCYKHNKLSGGEEKSQHLLSKAADVEVENKTPNEVYKFLDAFYYASLGLGEYATFTHIDSRTRRARWLITLPQTPSKNGGTFTPPPKPDDGENSWNYVSSLGKLRGITKRWQQRR